MSQDNRLLPLSPSPAPLDRPLRELTQPDRPNNTYSMPEPTHLRDYLQIILKRKWLILSIVVVVVSLTALRTYRQPSIYQAETTIQIEQKSKNLIKTKELVLNAGNDPTYWPTQLKLLENPRLLRKAILALNLQNDPAFTGGRPRTGLLSALRRVVSREQPKQEAAKAEGGLAVVNEDAPAVSTSEVKLSPEQEARMEGLENVLRSGLVIAPVERTNLVSIKFTHSDPALAMRVTDTLAQVFINDNVERETSGTKLASDQLAQKITDLQLELKRQQAQELGFKQSHDLPLGAAPAENQAALKLSTYGTQMMEAEAKLKAVQSEWEAAEQSLKQPDGLFSVPAVQQDKHIQDLQTKLQDLEQQRAALLVNYMEKYPAVVKIDEQKRNLERSINKRAQDAVAALKTNYESAKGTADKARRSYERTRGEVKQQGVAATMLTNIQQELETTKQMYLLNLQKQKELELAPSDLTNNITIATPARSPQLIGPPRVRNVLIALLLSLGAGVGLAFLLDYLDDTLKSIEDVDHHIHLPTLALIPAPRAERKRLHVRGGAGAPAADSPTALALVEDVRSPVTEAYRHLRTSLLLSSAGQPPRTILVTSSQPSEGKTTTAVNTALMLAQTGADVLVLDCDLRRPRVHAHFQLPNARGVTNYLSGDTDVASLIQQYEKLPNLKVITSGPVPPNAAELLGSEQMRRLLALLGQTYQHVVIDSPPAISFTDASILSTMVDGVMLVVHGGRSSRAIVRRAKQQLMDVGANIFGIVLNNVKLESSDYYYYSGYYQSYYSGEDEGGNGDGAAAEHVAEGTAAK